MPGSPWWVTLLVMALGWIGAWVVKTLFDAVALDVVRALILTCNRILTIGLDPETRQTWMELIAADLDEQEKRERARDHKPESVAWRLLGRSLRGTWGAVTWRLEEQPPTLNVSLRLLLLLPALPLLAAWLGLRLWFRIYKSMCELGAHVLLVGYLPFSFLLGNRALSRRLWYAMNIAVLVVFVVSSLPPPVLMSGGPQYVNYAAALLFTAYMAVFSIVMFWKARRILLDTIS